MWEYHCLKEGERTLRLLLRDRPPDGQCSLIRSVLPPSRTLAPFSISPRRTRRYSKHSTDRIRSIRQQSVSRWKGWRVQHTANDTQQESWLGSQVLRLRLKSSQLPPGGYVVGESASRRSFSVGPSLHVSCCTYTQIHTEVPMQSSCSCRLPLRNCHRVSNRWLSWACSLSS